MMIHDADSHMPSDLNIRPSLLRLGVEPVAGENFDILLLRGDHVVSASSRLPALDGATLDAARAFLICPDADFWAVALPALDRVMLLAPLPDQASFEAVAMLPDIGIHSMLRVLRHAFADQVRLHESWRGYGEERIREADENTYQYLQTLLSRCRAMLGGSAALRSLAVTDRKQLSHQLILTFRGIETFLGIELDGAHVREFPISLAYHGVFHPTRALWMLLCLTLGLERGFSRKVKESVRFVLDDEMLLPMLEMSAGNKTRLPVEWEECRRMAEREGMFFDVRRKRDAIRVRFCPLTPYISPQEFYSVRAMAAMIEGIREMKLQ